MRIDEVKLKNIGPHRELTVAFQSGLIGLMGSNGAGKSTLVNSIYSALTNDFSRFAGVKSEIISNVADESESSYIRLKGSHRGQAFQLTRWLRPNKNELLLDGNSFTKATEISQLVEEQLGISKLVIDKYVFVNQWEMFQFLSQTESERAKTFQFLCGTESASQIHKVCSDYVARQKGIEVIDNSLELEEAVAAALGSAKKHKKVCKKLKAQFLSSADIAEFKRVQEAHSAAETAKKKLEELKNKLTEAEIRHERCKKAVDFHYAEMQEKTKEIHRLISSKAFQVAVDYSKQYPQIKAKKLELQRAKTNLEVFELAFEKLVPPEVLLTYVKEADRQALEEELAELTVKHKNDSTVLKHFDSDSSAVCGYCQQSVTEDYVAAIRRRYDTDKSRIDELQSLLSASEQYDKDEQDYKKTHAELQHKIDSGKAAITKLRGEIPEEWRNVDKHAVKRLLADKSDLDDEMEKIQSALTEAKEQESRYGGIVTTLHDSVKAYSGVVSVRPSADEVRAANEALSLHAENKLAYSTALGAYREAKRNWQNASNMLEQLKIRLAERVKIRNLLATIEEAGDIFHWNNLPKTVSQANIELLVDDINDNLSLFNDPFYVEADQDLTFKVFFPGQPAVKAKQLSGGQKVVLAIAFRAALDRVFGHNVGMMFLDEPTAGLDADNVEYFHEALQQLAKKVSDSRQLVVITHVQELGEVFDQLIEIGG